MEQTIYDRLTKGVYVIAEMSANHNQDIEVAKETIRVAKECGANAVKLQTYTADTLTIDSKKEYFRLSQGTIWDGVTLYELYQQAYTPWEWHKELFEYAQQVGIDIFSTPFDFTAVDFLETLNVPCYKVASFEITDIPLIRYIASKGKPIILSVGIATLEEIEDAVMACKEMKNNQVILLQCVSQYPARETDACLSNMFALKEKFGVEIGLSDHTMGDKVATYAAAMGAHVIEKHFIIDRSIGGPDSSFSMNKEEFTDMVCKIRELQKIIGEPNFSMTEEKQKNRVFARSLFVVENISAGEVFTEKNIRSIRPGYGMPPKHYEAILGKICSMDVEKGEPLTWEMIEG